MGFFLKGLGDPATGHNEILPSFDAAIYAFLAQNAGGVCNSGANFAATTTDRGVSINSGLCYVNGYFGMSDSPTILNFNFPSGSAQFARVFAEVNLSVTPHRFSVRATNQSTSSNIQLTQDNLSIAASGLHQIPLFLVQLNNNRTITITDQRNMLHRIAEAQNAVHLTGSIANAATATTQTANNNSTRVATTAYADRAAQNALNITTASIVGGNGTVRRQGNFVILNGTGTAGVVPEGFRPRATVAIGANAGLSGQAMAQWPEMTNVSGAVMGSVTAAGVISIAGQVMGSGSNIAVFAGISGTVTYNGGWEV
ncbi:MAG: hypothetical protein FWE03_00410 [Firmicutes bacterium]|nr:hypothetical protein [Bacillota bacterium]